MFKLTKAQFKQTPNLFKITKHLTKNFSSKTQKIIPSSNPNKGPKAVSIPQKSLQRQRIHNTNKNPRKVIPIPNPTKEHRNLRRDRLRQDPSLCAPNSPKNVKKIFSQKFQP
jgi:hypothetical protein